MGEEEEKGRKWRGEEEAEGRKRRKGEGGETPEGASEDSVEQAGG